MIVNNDLYIEENCRWFCRTQEVCSMGSYSYSISPLGYGFSVGRYCSIAENVRSMGAAHFPNWISTSPHFYEEGFSRFEPSEITDEIRRKRRIIIGHDVWIGRDVVIKNDIKIGNGAIIGSNAVVTHDVPDFAIVVGVPARIIRYRFNDEMIERINRLKWWEYDCQNLKFENADNPSAFLETLEEKIILAQIEKYKPRFLTKEKIIEIVQHNYARAG